MVRVIEYVGNDVNIIKGVCDVDYIFFESESLSQKKPVNQAKILLSFTKNGLFSRL